MLFLYQSQIDMIFESKDAYINMIKLINIPDPLPSKRISQSGNTQNTISISSKNYLSVLSIAKSNQSNKNIQRNHPITTCQNRTPKQIQIQYENGYKLNMTDLNSLQKQINETVNKYVYPTILINFSRKYITPDPVRLVFSNNHLRELQMWCNQYREYYKQFASTPIQNRPIDYDNKCEYMLYKIGNRTVEHIIEDNNVRYQNN